MIAALYTAGKVVTGCHHGDAFSKLTEDEKDSPMRSGFIDPETLKFISDDCEFYLKKILMFRHAEAAGQDWNCSITQIGRSQAEKAAAFVVCNFSDYEMFASPYKRCYETAEIISRKVTGLADLQKQRPDESVKSFASRVGHVLETLPEKSIVISHCDFIISMAQLATCNVDMPGRMPNCSSTYIDNHEVVWVARIHD